VLRKSLQLAGKGLPCGARRKRTKVVDALHCRYAKRD